MSNPSLICVDVEGHLKDNPPQDAELSPSLLSYVSSKIAEVYDYTSIYDKVDSLACQILRDLKDQGRIRYEVVVLDCNNNWKRLHTYTRYCDADRRVDVYTDIYPHAICDIREVLANEIEGVSALQAMNSQMFKIKCDSFCCYAEDYQTALQSAVALLKAYGQRVIIFRPNEHTHFFTVDPDQSYEAVERALSAADGNLPPFC